MSNVTGPSGELRRELGLFDLVLSQILFIVGLGWVGTAALLGPAHVVFWLASITLFYLPTAAVVIYLSSEMPLEGGLYQWAKAGLSGLAGFLVAWNLMLYAIVNNSEIGLLVTTYLSYALGSSARWMAGSHALILAVLALLVGGITVLAAAGLGVGKWLHNIGAVAMLSLFAALVILPPLNRWHGTPPAQPSFTLTMPAFTLFNLNVLGKMGFGALGGFEYMAIVAGECRNPARTLGRSVLIAAPLIGLMFILGTGSVLFFVRPGQVDLIGPIPQVLALGSEAFGAAGAAARLAILAIVVVRIGQASLNFTGTTRLPMVAGWDRLLPGWFTRLHPRWKTPTNSILFVSIVTFAVGAAGVIGVGEQEAFQLLNNGSGILYALTYLAMFAIPILGVGSIRRPPLWLRAAACSGFLMTLLYVVLSVLPIVAVGSRLLFAAKIVLFIVAANALGTAVFVAAARRRSLEQAVS